ncbi:MAG TPA: hypothetical protein VN772_02400 [Solirubrobacteraceae bacterium]|nr:hypothetical protein [Solirubrobacteraceae bacterium]
MPELSGRELLSEWRKVMDSVISTAASAAGRPDLPAELMRATQRQLELLQQLVDAEQRLQGNLVGGLFAPVEAVLDLLGETGATLRRQAEATEAAGRALQETAGLMKTQAELFERLIATLRQPTGLAKAAAGGGRRRAPAKPARARSSKKASDAGGARSGKASASEGSGSRKRA